MEKILTVVIPTYNMEKYLDKCLTSLIMPENMDELEVLIVNDGSKDSSLQIALKYEKLYPQTFIAIDKKNGNYGSCINKGLEKATGKYFKVLDADDSFNTENLCEYIKFLRKLDVDLVMSDFMIVDQSNDINTTIDYKLPVNIVFSFEYLVKKNVPYMWMHAVTHRTEKMRNINYFQQEGISYTDKEFVFYPMAVSKTVAYFPKVLYLYLMGREGQTIDDNVWIKNYWMEVKAIMKLLIDYKEHKNEVSTEGLQFMQQQATLYISSIYHRHLQSGRKKLSINQLIDFDKWLKSLDEDLYHCMDKEKETAEFYFIKEWRKYKNNMKGYLIHRFIHRISYHLGIRSHKK